MKQVSFETAKWLKANGYPQEQTEEVYCLEGDRTGRLVAKGFLEFYDTADAPTYMDVWLWLWQEKNIRITVEYIGFAEYCVYTIWQGSYILRESELYQEMYPEPEGAIISALEYLQKHSII